MLNLCQKVNVYNIESHYHLYSEKDQASRQQYQNINFKKLKTGCISLTSGAISKRGSKSCKKKKLNLSKNLIQHQDSEPLASNNFKKGQSEKDQQFPTLIQQSQSTIINQALQNTTQNQNNSKNLLTTCYKSGGLNPEQFQLLKQPCNKRKPSILQYQKEQNNMLISQLYATRYQQNLRKVKSINLTKINRQPIQESLFQNNNHIYKLTQIQQVITERDQHQFQNRHKSFFRQVNHSKNHSQFNLDSNVKTKCYLEMKQLNINLESKDQLNKKQAQDRPRKNLNNSKYNVSILSSLTQSVMQNQGFLDNQNFYQRFLRAPNREARQASIILSNILSRNSNIEKNYASCHQRTSSLAQNRPRFNLEDKQTILSHQNDLNSQCSLKIQQSLICELDPKDNFRIISDVSIATPEYSVSLALQKNINCIVSLKQIEFRLMSSISQQLQIYQFVDQILKGRDTYRNILELYQVQTTNYSYIMIKQPFTQNLQDYSQKLSSQYLIKLIQEFKLTIKTLLLQFAHHMIYPTRLLHKSDFVVCESIVKIHNLSIFKQSKNQVYSIEQIISSLQFTQGKTDRE